MLSRISLKLSSERSTPGVKDLPGVSNSVCWSKAVIQTLSKKIYSELQPFHHMSLPCFPKSEIQYLFTHMLLATKNTFVLINDSSNGFPPASFELMAVVVLHHRFLDLMLKVTICMRQTHNSVLCFMGPKPKLSILLKSTTSPKKILGKKGKRSSLLI